MPAGPNRTRAEGRRLRRLALLAGLLAATGAQTSGAQVAPAAPAVPTQTSPQRVPAEVITAPALTTDTARTRPAPVLSTDTAEPNPQLTRRGAARIGGVVGLIILTTLLLYNVRSR